MCRVFPWVAACWTTAVWDLSDFVQIGVEGDVSGSELRDDAGHLSADFLVADELEEFTRWC